MCPPDRQQQVPDPHNAGLEHDAATPAIALNVDRPAHGRVGNRLVAPGLHFSPPVQERSTSPRIPLATYRLQFNASFTFADALPIVEYLHALGVSDIYASPYLRSVPGSPHGYDVADPTRLNPEIGTDEEYSRLVDALKARGMGHVRVAEIGVVNGLADLFTHFPVALVH